MTDIFDEIVRFDETPARDGELLFDFLNRTSRKFFRRVCDQIEVWYRQSCPEKQPELRMRLRSPQFNEAFWELFIETLLRKHGWDVTCHPAIPGSARSPDFLVKISPDGPRFYVEATVSKYSDDDSADNARLDALKRHIEDNVKHARFMLDVSVISQGPDDPPKASLIREIQVLLGKQDPDDVERRFKGAASTSVLPSLTWERSGWRVTVRALPVRARDGSDVDRRIVGMMGPAEASIVNRSGSLRKSISKKARRYGSLSGPYVVAVRPTALGTSENDIVSALFGSAAVTFRRGVAESGRPTRMRNGLWIAPNGPTNRTVSAVLTPPCDYGPWAVGKGMLTLWHNPRAKSPLTLDYSVFREMRVDNDGGIVESAPGMAPGELLELPDDWPGPDPPFA